MYVATQKFHLDVRSMSNFTYPEKLTYKLLTHMMKIWSLIKDRVLAPNALQQELNHSIPILNPHFICINITIFSGVYLIDFHLLTKVVPVHFTIILKVRHM